LTSDMAMDTNRLGRIFTCIRKGGWVTWLVSTLVVLLSLPVTGRYIHGQIPESIRSHIPVQQVQDAINYVNPAILAWMLPDDQTEEKINAIKMKKPMAPHEHGVLQFREMFNVYDLKKCTAWEDVDPKFYEKLIDVTGRELNLTEDVTDAMKLAQHAGKVVNALEKFEQNEAGQFYFGRYQTRRRSNKNMDIAVVLYGFRWSLFSSEMEKETGQWLSSLTARQKDLVVKSFRSKAVEAFSEICPSELLSVVDPKEIQDSAGNNDEEDKDTKKMFARFLEFLEKEAKPADFEGKM